MPLRRPADASTSFSTSLTPVASPGATSASPAALSAVTSAADLAPIVREINGHLSSLARLKLAVESITASVADLTPITRQAQELTVDSKETMLEASNRYLFGVREARKKVVEIMAPFKDPLNETKSSVMKLEHALDDPLAEAERVIKAKLARWETTERARVAEENRRREEEIDRKAREESRLAAEADRKRQEEAVEARRAQEARTAQERREAQEKAEAARRESIRLAEAQRVAALEVDELAAVPKQKVAKAAGHSTREIGGWEVADFPKLVAAVAREEVPYAALAPNDEFIDGMFQADAAITCGWPGLKHVVRTIVAGR